MSKCLKKVERAITSGIGHVPRCRSPDGTYEPVQCDQTTHECWCVNDMGKEINGTRSRNYVLCGGECIHELDKVILGTGMVYIKGMFNMEKFSF